MKNNFSLWHRCLVKSTTCMTTTNKHVTGKAIFHIRCILTVINNMVHTWLSYTFSKVSHHLGTWYNFIFSNSTTVRKDFFIVPFTIPIFDAVNLKRTQSFSSFITTDKVKMQLSKAIHSRLPMAPRGESFPHNNKLLRQPEDTIHECKE